MYEYKTCVRTSRLMFMTIWSRSARYFLLFVRCTIFDGGREIIKIISNTVEMFLIRRSEWNKKCGGVLISSWVMLFFLSVYKIFTRKSAPIITIMIMTSIYGNDILGLEFPTSFPKNFKVDSIFFFFLP